MSKKKKTEFEIGQKYIATNTWNSFLEIKGCCIEFVYKRGDIIKIINININQSIDTINIRYSYELYRYGCLYPMPCETSFSEGSKMSKSLKKI